MGSSLRHRLFILLAALLLLPLMFFLLLLVQHHPLLIAWRSGLHIWVPYWDTWQRPTEVFNGWPTTHRFDFLGINFVSVSNGTLSWWNLWIEPLLLVVLTVMVQFSFIGYGLRNLWLRPVPQRGFEVIGQINCGATPPTLDNPGQPPTLI